MSDIADGYVQQWRDESEPTKPGSLERVVGQQRLEALVEAERVLDVMYSFYRHRGPWETIHGTQTLEKVRRAIALSNVALTRAGENPK